MEYEQATRFNVLLLSVGIEAVTRDRNPTTTCPGELYAFLVKWTSSAAEAVKSPGKCAVVKSPCDLSTFASVLSPCSKDTGTQGDGAGPRH